MRLQERSMREEWRNTRPRWWLLYVIATLLVAVVGLVELSVDGQRLREILEALAVVAGFGLIGIWLRGNRIALDLEQGRHRT
jgi:hydrogenase/urease accessory protein HupE